jgi:hypothetical protein
MEGVVKINAENAAIPRLSPVTLNYTVYVNVTIIAVYSFMPY